MKSPILLLISAVSVCLTMNSQVITSSPEVLQVSSDDVIIYFHADQGGGNLKGTASTTSLYAHTGVTADGKQWQYVVADWNTNLSKCQLQYVSEDLWQLYIGDIRQFYGISDSDIDISQLNFVIRNENGSKQTEDLFYDVQPDGFQVSLSSNLTGNVVNASTGSVTFTVDASETATISLSINGTTIATQTGTQLTYSYTFPSVGDYLVEATASNNDETVTRSLYICYAQNSQQATYPGGVPQMGTVVNSDGSVTFCIAAPDKSDVVIVGSWNDYIVTNSQVMNYQDYEGARYFWTTLSDLDNATMYPYYFIIDSQYNVGDPYAKLVLDPWNDGELSEVFPNLPDYPKDKIQGVPLAVYQGNINDYEWKITDFKGADANNLIIYELLFRDFTGTEGAADANGTVQQAITKLSYLKTLGINAIELMPIMEFNGNDSWGYNTNFYFAPDKAYGTPDDYKEFIDLCHQNDIAVILDIVFNQSDGLHPWYMMYQPEDNPFYNSTAPHAYSVLNDWNQGYALVQQQWTDALKYWLTEYKVDGFRFDLVKGLGDNSSYSSSTETATNGYNQSRIDRMIALQETVESVNPNAYFINEDLAFAEEENAMAQYGQLNWANVNDAGCQFAMGYQSGSNLNRFYAPNDSSRLWGSTVSYLESHDEQRLAYKVQTWGVSGVTDNDAATCQRLGSAAAQMILSPGAHMIWMFSEIGNSQNTKTTDGNDTSPKIVNWDLLNNDDNKGLYDSYCQLIALRNNNPELFSEDASFTMACNYSDWNNGRWLYSVSADKTKELYTLINPNTSGSLTISNVPFLTSGSSDYVIVSQSYGSDPTFDVSAKTVTVPANCYVSIANNSVTEINEITADSLTEFKAWGKQGSIVLENVESIVEIFSLDGRKVAESIRSGSIPVASGIYVVRHAGKSVKVVVR